MTNSPIPPAIANAVISLLKPYVSEVSLADLELLCDTRRQDDRFLKVKEAADSLNVCELTIRRMVNAGKVTAYKIGGALRISDNSLRASIEIVEPGKGSI